VSAIFYSHKYTQIVGQSAESVENELGDINLTGTSIPQLGSEKRDQSILCYTPSVTINYNGEVELWRALKKI
jgi:hypothetical protein